MIAAGFSAVRTGWGDILGWAWISNQLVATCISIRFLQICACFMSTVQCHDSRLQRNLHVCSIAQIRNNRRVKTNWDDRAGKNQRALRRRGLGSVSMARDA
jgi:hypothetical protein